MIMGGRMSFIQKKITMKIPNLPEHLFKRKDFSSEVVEHPKPPMTADLKKLVDPKS